MELPARDTIANVALNLFFLPLVRRETERLSFQIFLCRGGARFMDFEAKRVENGNSREPNALVEVSYKPDLGGVLSRLQVLQIVGFATVKLRKERVGS